MNYTNYTERLNSSCPLSIIRKQINQTAPTHLEPEHIAIDDEYLRNVLCLMEEFPQEQQDILQLSSIGISQKEIAHKLNIKVGNVKVQLHRGRKALIALLEAKYPEEYTESD